MMALPGARMLFERRGPKLPYDAEVEYLESTGTQLIDTGVHGRDNLLVGARFAIASIPLSGSQYVFIGAYGRSFIGVMLQGSTGNFRFAAISSLYGAAVPIDTEVHDVLIDSSSGSKRVLFDDVEIASSAGSFSGEYTETVALFGRIGYANGCQARLYSFAVNDASTGDLIQSLFPVRFTNEQGVSEGAMYDRVSGQLFRNGGTGAFVIGPDKTANSDGGGGYKCVEYSPLSFSRFSRLWKEAA